MTKQEFLAMSLPFSLKCLELQHRGDKKGEIGTFTGYELDMFSIIKDIRLPILHPLSDLTNSDIKSIGFKVRLEVSNASNNGDWILLLNGGFNLKTSPFYVIEILVKNHFDIAGLIEKGEAIDVNTLEVNPYK